MRPHKTFQQARILQHFSAPAFRKQLFLVLWCCVMRPKLRGPLRGQSYFSRRNFLERLSSFTSGFAALPLPFGSVLATLGPFAFEEIPAEKSGITWVHTAGKSPEKYLPETSGAGCAFLDYDNDGWMDIYLINSGK